MAELGMVAPLGRGKLNDIIAVIEDTEDESIPALAKAALKPLVMQLRFTTAAALVHELIEAADERHLQRLQKQLVSQDLLIIDELGFVPLSKTGAELLFEVISQRYERGSIIITSNLPFDEWTEVFGAERLTGAILDRLTHHVNILEMNGESYRLRQSKNSKTQS